MFFVTLIGNIKFSSKLILLIGYLPGQLAHPLLPAFSSAAAVAAVSAAKRCSDVSSSQLGKIEIDRDPPLSDLHPRNHYSIPLNPSQDLNSSKLSSESKPLSLSPSSHNLSFSKPNSETADSERKPSRIEDDMEVEANLTRVSSPAAMSSGSVDEDLEDESVSETPDEDDDIAEDLSIKSQTPTKSNENGSSSPSPASSSLIGELMSKFGFNDIQEYQVKPNATIPLSLKHI